ncbi:MAG: hypothetical protein AB1798_13470 [Spirochaetota bacterium]
MKQHYLKRLIERPGLTKISEKKEREKRIRTLVHLYLYFLKKREIGLSRFFMEQLKELQKKGY